MAWQCHGIPDLISAGWDGSGEWVSVLVTCFNFNLQSKTQSQVNGICFIQTLLFVQRCIFIEHHDALAEKVGCMAVGGIWVLAMPRKYETRLPKWKQARNVGIPWQVQAWLGTAAFSAVDCLVEVAAITNTN